MKVMVVGSGGREYSIGLALKKDPNVTELFFAPGNGATSRLGSNVSYRNYEELAAYAKKKRHRTYRRRTGDGFGRGDRRLFSSSRFSDFRRVKGGRTP